MDTIHNSVVGVNVCPRVTNLSVFLRLLSPVSPWVALEDRHAHHPTRSLTSPLPWNPTPSPPQTWGYRVSARRRSAALTLTERSLIQQLGTSSRPRPRRCESSRCSAFQICGLARILVWFSFYCTCSPLFSGLQRGGCPRLSVCRSTIDTAGIGAGLCRCGGRVATLFFVFFLSLLFMFFCHSFWNLFFSNFLHFYLPAVMTLRYCTRPLGDVNLKP